ncbi:MAG TPA: hypothetical protein PKL96_07965, partial [Bacteroidales bacterium]|nr:hypothetical protein [Bacteroidales bacterium]HPS26920.1 hypothetical protein [Bacteroidales bacterium]
MKQSSKKASIINHFRELITTRNNMTIHRLNYIPLKNKLYFLILLVLIIDFPDTIFAQSDTVIVVFGDTR